MIIIDMEYSAIYYCAAFGALAQLGERNTGSVEVSGSIPLGSTKILKKPDFISGFFSPVVFVIHFCNLYQKELLS